MIDKFVISGSLDHRVASIELLSSFSTVSSSLFASKEKCFAADINSTRRLICSKVEMG